MSESSPIFICYPRENQDVVKALARDLEALGHQPWFDEQLTGGKTWWDHILAKIRECRVVVFALGPQSIESEACKRECDYARSLSKPILPVLVAQGVSVELLPEALSTVHFVDYREQDKEAAFALLRALQALPSPQPLPKPLPEPPEVPISYVGEFQNAIDSPREMGLPEQTALVFKIKQHLRKGDDTQNALRLLRELKNRPDCLARIAEEIDELLAEKAVPARLPERERPPRMEAPAVAPTVTTTKPSWWRKYWRRVLLGVSFSISMLFILVGVSLMSSGSIYDRTDGGVCLTVGLLITLVTIIIMVVVLGVRRLRRSS